MKASQLIIELQKAIALHGDLPATVQDGLDPSDECAVEAVEHLHDRFLDGNWTFRNVPHFYIR